MTDRRDRFETLFVATSLGFGGYLAVVVWAVVLLALARSVTPPIDAIERHAVNTAALALGTLMAVRVYLTWSDRTTAFLDLDRPTPREVGVAVVAIPVLWGVGVLAGVLGVAPAEHGLVDAVRTGGLPVAATVAVTSLVVVGPAEELLYRNLVQKTVAEQFSTPSAIVVASAIFAAVHTTAFWTGAAIPLLSALALVFTLSLVLGTLYALTGRVFVAAIAHGGYDAVVFLLLVADPPAV